MRPGKIRVGLGLASGRVECGLKGKGLQLHVGLGVEDAESHEKAASATRSQEKQGQAWKAAKLRKAAKAKTNRKNLNPPNISPASSRLKVV